MTTATLNRPSFKSLFEDYLAAFNAHDISKVLSFLSPNLIATYKGRTTVNSAEEARKAYLAHWARADGPITVHALVECEDGVDVALNDNEGFRTSVRYRYAEEDGRWVHSRHDVGERVPL
jgi:ketosteroid isomerase-like protein